MSSYGKKVRRQRIIIFCLIVAIVSVVGLIVYDTFYSNELPFLERLNSWIWG